MDYKHVGRIKGIEPSFLLGALAHSKGGFLYLARPLKYLAVCIRRYAGFGPG